MHFAIIVFRHHANILKLVLAKARKSVCMWAHMRTREQPFDFMSKKTEIAHQRLAKDRYESAGAIHTVLPFPFLGQASFHLSQNRVPLPWRLLLNTYWSCADFHTKNLVEAPDP